MEPPVVTAPTPTQPPLDATQELVAPPATPPPSTIPAGPPRVPALPAVPPVGRPLLDLRPFFRLTTEYSDNFDQTPEGQDNLRTTAAPGLALGVEGPRLRGRLSGTFAATHDTSSDDISFFYGLDAVASWDVTPRLTFQVSDTLARTDEPGQADRLELRRGRNTFTRNSFTGDILYRIADVQTRAFYRNSLFLEQSRAESDVTTHVAGGDVAIPMFLDVLLTLGYEYLHSSNDTDIRGHRGVFSLLRRATENLTLGVTGSHATRKESEADPALPDDRFQISTASLFGSYTLLPRWTVTASVGVAQLRSDERDDEVIPTAALSLSHAFVRGVATLTAERGFSETFAAGESFGVVETQGVSLTFTYPTTPFSTLTLSGFYRENDFTGVGGDGDRSGSEETFGGRAVFGWTPRPWLVLTLEYGYRKVSAAAEDFDENRVLLGVGVSF